MDSPYRFSRERLYWIPVEAEGRLAIMPRPRAGEWLGDAIASWFSEGVDTVVSLLEPAEVRDLDLQHEETLCGVKGLSFVSFPIRDRDVPESLVRTAVQAEEIVALLGAGKSVAIHCRAGIGRSATIAACVLVTMGNGPKAAFEAISAARGCETPDTPGQRAFVGLFEAYLTEQGA